MARFKILSKDGATTRYEGKPRYIGSYLRPSYLEFSEIASDKPIAWEVGDYVEYSRTGMRYYLYSIPQVSKNARSGSHGKAFSYSNVQFHAASKDLEIAPFRDIVPDDNGVHFSSSPEVATFEDVYGIARRIQACMDEIYPGKWQIIVTSFDSVEDADIYDLLHTPKNFALSGGTCLDALSKIYELWGETGWYHFYYSVSGMNVIMIGYSSRAVGSNTVAGFYYGKGKGLTAIKKTQINKDELATRLYVYGSERNLPLRWYNGLNIANAESVDIRNLMLPLDRWGKTNGLPDARKAYLENAEAVAKYGIIPKSHYFDSDDAGADLYPTIEGMTVGMVRKDLADMGESKYVPSSQYSDSERVDEVYASSPTVDNGVLKKNGAEHNYTEGFTYAGATTPMVTIAKGTDEETAIVENHLLYQSDVALDKVYRAKVTASADLACRVPDKGFSIVRGELRLDSTLEGAEPKGKMDVFFHLDEEKKEWVLDIPNISADYVDASYVRYQIYLTLSVYVTPKEALSSDVTTNMTISEGGIDIIIDQIFDKTFSLSLKQIGFNIAERAALGEGKVISMKSGMCEGRNFVIKTCRFVESNDTWRIECARQKDDNLGMLFPNTDYQIKAGDRFVLLDIAMPDTYIYANMERVYTEGMKLLEKASKVQYHYEPVIDAKVMAESEKAIREGMFLEFVDDDIIDTTFVRLVIDTLNIYEDESAIPTYRVTLKEKKKVSYKGTPSATSETRTSSYGDEGADGGSVDIDLTDYATKEWVRGQKYTTEEWTNQQGFLKTIEGSDFVEYNEGKVSLVLDEQGGLGERGQGLGIVTVPQDALSDSLKTINGESIVGTGNIIIQGGGGGITNESDPIFKASPAAKITDEDIERWNTDNGADIVMDTEMSDTSENAVQNKVIKEYVDLHPRYETIEEIVPPEEVEDFATKEWARQTFTEPSDFKTINGQSIVGEGDIELNGGKITLDTEMSDESENGVQNKVIKAYVDGKVETINTAELINVTYEEMLEKSLMGKLTAGAKYRIIDYYTTVEQDGVMAETGQFDIVVVADSEYMVNEEAHAVDAYKTLQGYYAIGGAIYAWRIRYTLIPFYPTRFEWACFGDEYMVLAPEINVEVPFTRISPTYTEDANGEQMYCFFSASVGFPMLAYCKSADPQVGDIMLIEGNEYPISSIVPHERGKGVIYDMTDEWGNSAPYDFKNIKFRAYGSNVGGFTFEPRDGAYERWVHTFEGDDMIDASDAGNLDVTVPSGDFFFRMRFAVYNNKIKYFPVRLKPIVVHGDRSSYSDATTMFVDTQIHDNEFINCDRLSAFVNSNSVLRNCENVTIRYNGETFNDNIRIDCLKGEEGNPIVIEGLVTSSEYTTHIGKNSQGEVKIWNPADLV